ncbi:MAG: L-seryl-tRNA(Sec) selenium transferase [Candidatus Eisenbacteria bacterium]|nr:L-seryl-tRNA(Sec) selenium transferase [Candidatus Eisenbacteria bacterium]
MVQKDRADILRGIPSVELILDSEHLRSISGRYCRALTVSAVREVVDEERRSILEGERRKVSSPEEIAARVIRALEERMTKSMRRLVNATGVVLHTNVGRAILSESAVGAVTEAARYYTNLEYDIEEGRRTSRQVHFDRLLRELTGAETSHVVNNNAGAVLLALNTLAEGKEVIVSRGELVEIGGSFRLPEVMAKSGALLVEVGTTNRTTVGDYERAICEKTALLLKVHKSNFKMVGFVSEVSLEELVGLGKSKKVPVMEDLGSGALIDFSLFGLPGEPLVSQRILAGADVVTFSGDKLLGGPQAGVIVGKKEFVMPMRENPLSRALRIDKLTATALEATLLEMLDTSTARERVPSVRMITEEEESVRRRVEALLARVKASSDVLDITAERGLSQIGGGALPEVGVPTWIIVVRCSVLDECLIEKILREGEVAIVARVEKGAVCLDLRTVLPEEEKIVEEALKHVAEVARQGVRGTGEGKSGRGEGTSG